MDAMEQSGDVCRRAADAIESIGDGEVSRREVRFLESHVEECPECESYLDRMRLVLAALGEMKRVPAPEELLEAVMAYLLGAVRPQAAAGERQPRRRRGILVLAGAAGVGVAVAAAVAISRWSGGHRPDDGLAASMG
ncbi:MAG: zf-HC2 domain-containing protein [Actinobacteria bacterium]|nr:zf-HC2 domain-containing protein [Actinomycetota bacterium]MBU1944402.1 zf-HC2 domain-containing protein [Actinomycetota bacterium]MBU2688188.1 zf-HC2 domain-containing protein [Actinomycetota bacterium]